MFINISKDTIIRTKDIIGIFNLDYIRNTKEYKNFLSNMIEKKEIEKISEKERTFILTNNNKNTKGYITNISTNTIVKRKKIGGKIEI